MHRLITLIVLFTVMLPPGPAAVARDSATPPTSASGATMTIIVNSLTSPRGFAWADDGRCTWLWQGTVGMRASLSSKATRQKTA